MHRAKQACADKLLAMVTEAVVHGVYKVVAWSSFSVIHQCVTRSHMTFGQ